ELHAEYFARKLADLVDRAGQLDPAALATAAGVDLGLDHPDLAAQRFGGLDRIIDRETGDAPGHRDPVLAQDLLALVLVDFHRCSSIIRTVMVRENARCRAGRRSSPRPSSRSGACASGAVRGIDGSAGHCSNRIRPALLARTGKAARLAG